MNEWNYIRIPDDPKDAVKDPTFRQVAENYMNQAIMYGESTIEIKRDGHYIKWRYVDS